MECHFIMATYWQHAEIVLCHAFYHFLVVQIGHLSDWLDPVKWHFLWCQS